MKLRNILVGVFALLVVVAFTTPAPVIYKIDSTKSKLHWIGRKVTGEHAGAISLKDGQLETDGKTIKGGSFTIDMTSITNTDIEDATYSNKLVAHLKSDDFFSTEKFPTAQLLITKVTPAGKDTYNMTGTLTIKGITKEISFPATVKTSGNQLTAHAKIIVNRAQYEVRYGSDSFFENLGDKAIHDDFELNVELVASK